MMRICTKPGLSRWLSGKEFTCPCWRQVDKNSILGLERSPGKKKWQPTPVFLPWKFHGQRNLVGYSPWGHKESDTTEQLTLSLLLFSPLCPDSEIVWLCSIPENIPSGRTRILCYRLSLISQVSDLQSPEHLLWTVRLKDFLKPRKIDLIRKICLL